MRRTTVIVAALGIFGLIGSTPVVAGPAASTDEPTQFEFAKYTQYAQYQATETVGASSTTKKKKPKKKQRYERSN